MEISSVCIIGGSGFVGRSIAEQACARSLRVRVVTRSEPRARHLLVLPTVETQVGDPNDEKALARALDGMDAVVDLVGILHPSGRASFAGNPLVVGAGDSDTRYHPGGIAFALSSCSEYEPSGPVSA